MFQITTTQVASKMKEVDRLPDPQRLKSVILHKSVIYIKYSFVCTLDKFSSQDDAVLNWTIKSKNQITR